LLCKEDEKRSAVSDRLLKACRDDNRELIDERLKAMIEKKRTLQRRKDAKFFKSAATTIPFSAAFHSISQFLVRFLSEACLGTWGAIKNAL